MAYTVIEDSAGTPGKGYDIIDEEKPIFNQFLDSIGLKAKTTSRETQQKESENQGKLNSVGNILPTQPDMSKAGIQKAAAKTKLESYLEQHVGNPLVDSTKDMIGKIHSFLNEGSGYVPPDVQTSRQYQNIVSNISPTHSEGGKFQKGFWGNIGNVGNKAIESVSSMIPYIVGSQVVGPVGTATAFGMITGGDVYERARAEGVPDDLSKQLSIIGGGIGTIFGAAFEKSVSNPLTKTTARVLANIGKNIVKTVAFNEGIVMGVEGISSTLIEFGKAMQEETKHYSLKDGIARVLGNTIEAGKENLTTAALLAVPHAVMGVHQLAMKQIDDVLTPTGTIDHANLPKGNTFTPEQRIFLTDQQKKAADVDPSMRTPEEHKLVQSGWDRLTQMNKQDKIQKKTQEIMNDIKPKEETDETPVSEAIGKHVILDGNKEGVLKVDNEGNLIVENGKTIHKEQENPSLKKIKERQQRLLELEVERKAEVDIDIDNLEKEAVLNPSKKQELMNKISESIKLEKSISEKTEPIKKKEEVKPNEANTEKGKEETKTEEKVEPQKVSKEKKTKEDRSEKIRESEYSRRKTEEYKLQYPDKDMYEIKRNVDQHMMAREVIKNRGNAKDIALGIKEGEKGLLNNAVADMLVNTEASKPEKERNVKDLGEIIKATSLRSTRYGQEIQILSSQGEYGPSSLLMKAINKKKEVVENKINIDKDEKITKPQKLDKVIKEQLTKDKKEINLKAAKIKAVEDIINSIIC